MYVFAIYLSDIYIKYYLLKLNLGLTRFFDLKQDKK